MSKSEKAKITVFLIIITLGTFTMLATAMFFALKLVGL